MFDKVYFGNTPIKSIYLGDTPIKYNTDSLPNGYIEIARYTFNTSIGTLPTFNSGFEYAYTDVINESSGTTTRTIISEDTPSSISFANKTGLIAIGKLLVTNKITSLASMLNGCKNLTHVNTKGWDTSNVTTMAHFMSGCTSLSSIDLSTFVFNSGINITYAFQSSGLTHITLPANLVINQGYRMLQYSTSLTSVDFNGATFAGSCDNMCIGCTSLTEVKMDGCKINGANLAFAFKETGNLKTISMNNIAVSHPYLIGSMLNGSSIVRVIMDEFNPNQTNYLNMFKGVTTIEYDVQFPTWATSVTSAFQNCTNLKYVTSNWNTTYDGNITTGSCYSGCTAIETIDGIVDTIDSIPSTWK